METFEAEYISLEGNKIFLKDKTARKNISTLNGKVTDIEKEINGVSEMIDVINGEVIWLGLIQKLNYLLDTKEAIKEAIVNKKVEISDTDTFRSYADKINDININQVITTESSVQPPNVSYSIINQFLITESEVMKHA